MKYHVAGPRSGPCGTFSQTLSVLFLAEEARSLISVFPKDVQPSFQSILSGVDPGILSCPTGRVATGTLGPVQLNFLTTAS